MRQLYRDSQRGPAASRRAREGSHRPKTRTSLSRAGWVYVVGIIAGGVVPIGVSLVELSAGPPSDSWLLLAALTLLVGTFSVRVRATGLTISFTEPLLFAIALCFGAGPATLVVAADGLLVSARARRRGLSKVLFNIAEPALSMWLSARLFFLLSGVEPMYGRQVELAPLLFPLLVLTTSYLGLNAVLTAVPLWLEKGVSLKRLVNENRLQVGLNLAASFTLASVLVYNANSLSLTTLVVLIPLLLMSYVTSRAVGDQTETREALRRSEARLRELAANITEVLWMADIETQQMLYLSPAFDAIWGRPGAAVRQRDGEWLDTVHPDDRDRVAAAFRASPSPESRLQYRIVRPDGAVRWITDRVFPVPDQDGVVRRVAGVAEDMTDRRGLEQQLAQSQRLEGIGRMAGGVAHDFNNILMVVLGRAGRLMSALDPCDARWRDAREIKGAGERAAALTQQLLAFSRQQTLTMQVLDLNRVVRDVSQMLRRLIGEDIVFEMRLGADVGHVTGDTSQLDQMLVNLAVNARDAMPHGGRLVVETATRHLDEGAAIELSIPAGAYVMLAVTDNGTGMDEDTRARVFEPFFSTKQPGKGTGLGLATLYGTVQQLGGQARVLTSSRRGTRFEILLPRTDAPLAVTASAAAAPVTRCARGTVLLVEDDASVRTVVSDMLAQAGFRVLEADGAPSALALAAREAGTLDLILTDFIMPGMNGRELVGRLAAVCPGARALYMSGYSKENVTGPEGGLGRTESLITKPFTDTDLLDRVEQVLQERRPPTRSAVPGPPPPPGHVNAPRQSVSI